MYKGKKLGEIVEALSIGDLMYTLINDQPCAICLVTEVNAHSIFARVINAQIKLTFDKSTLTATIPNKTFVILSLTPLPVNIRNIMLGIDRKSRLEHLVDRFKYTTDEIEAFKFALDFYPSNPLPERNP